MAAEIGAMATDIKKPAEAGLKPELLLLVSDRVGWRWINSSRFYYKTRERFECDKCTTAVDVLALMVTFFRFSTQISTGASMRGILA